MARKSKRSRGTTVRLARQTLTTPLGHTASRTLDFYEPFTPAQPRRGFSPSPVRDLIRTVLVEHQPPPPRRSTPRSPTVQARATGRSDDRKARSPFLTAQGITPELTNRAIVCATRNIRREVLFATKRTGKGAQAPRKPRSNTRC